MMDTAVGLTDAESVLDLANIRSTLMYRTPLPWLAMRDTDLWRSRLEDTITIYLIERVQYPLNRIWSP